MYISSSFARKGRRVADLFVKSRKCPMCGWAGYRFEPFGSVATYRQDAQCALCGSLERHRLAFLLLRDRISRGQRVLHVAPEQTVTLWLVSLSSEYLSVDLHHHAMRRMDLTNLELADGSKTLVWCSHVLQYISDDRKALSEIYRVLEPGGLLVLQVPIEGDLTYECPDAKSDYDSFCEFSFEDSLRLYGSDLKRRVEQVGFQCDVLTSSLLRSEEKVCHAADAKLFREVFFCHRPKTNETKTTTTSNLLQPRLDALQHQHWLDRTDTPSMSPP
jgi:SAM-dependent methyltransferase